MPSQKKKILIVEDEKPMARAMELKLTHSGFEAKIAHNGEEALSLLESESFDAMLLDVMMPKMDGFDVLTALKSKKINIPVMVLSNLSQESDAKKALELGAKEYFIKSNTPITEIVERVERMLSSP